MRCSSWSLFYVFSTDRCSWLNQSVFFFVLIVASATSLAAQDATLVGTVTEQTGALLPRVTVTITNAHTEVVRSSITNSEGQYVAFALPVGTYNVKAESSGFETQESQGVVLNVNDRARVDFQMKIGTRVEPVLVESTPIRVQADSGEQSSLISGIQIAELSTNVLCGSPGGGGGAGAYARAVLAVTPGNTYSVTVGTGGAEDTDGTATQFTDGNGTVLLQANGGVQGFDAGSTKSCVFLSAPLTCGSGGTAISSPQIGHSGTAGSWPSSNTCLPSGGAGYPVQGFSSTVGGGGSGAYTTAACSSQPSIGGQNGYAVVTW